MLMALDRYLEDPNDGITEWPRWPDLLQCPLETVADHPWSHHGQPSQDSETVLAATEDSQMDGEEEVTDAVDKGKGREYEVSNDEVSLSQAAGGEEVRGSRRGRGRGQTRGRSQSHCPHKRVKSAPMVDSDEEENPTGRGSNKTFDLQHPPPDFLILPAVDRCKERRSRMLPMQQIEAWVQPGIQTGEVSVMVACTNQASQSQGVSSIEDSPTGPYSRQPFPFNSQAQSPESHSRG